MLTDLFRQMLPLQWNTFFGEILVRGFRASFLIVLVIGIRFVLRKAPHWTHCALWLVVFAELIIPIKIESPFSAYRYISSSEPVEEYFEVQGDNAEMHVDSLEVFGYQDSQQEQIRKKTIHTGNTHIPDLISLWSMGVCVLLINAFGHYISLRIKIREAVPLRDNIWICDEVKSPFVLGLIKSRIYLSASMEESQIEYVVAHEQAHLQRKDQWWKLIGYFVRCIYWMNPLVWIAYVLFCRDLEFACDEKVIRDYDMEEKKAYLTALLACSTQKKMVLARSTNTNIFRLYSISESGNIVNIADDNGMESSEKSVSFFLKQKAGSTNVYTCIYDNVLGKEVEKEWIWNGDGKYIEGY